MADFSHITTWIFDMDETLYPKGSGFRELCHGKFYEHAADITSMSVEEAKELGNKFHEKYGDARVGFMKETTFELESWEDITAGLDYKMVPVCTITQEKLGVLPGRKVIFTDAGRPHAERMLSHLQIDHHFDHVDDFSTRGYRNKPNVEIYHELVEALKADPQQCAFFEDTEKNLKPAYDIGMTTVLIKPEPPTADYVHHHYPNMLDFFDDCLGKYKLEKAS